MKDDNQELVDFQILSLKYKTRLTRKFKERKKYEVPDPNKLKSVIPGTVVEIKAKKGQKLKEGDVILLLEAMKMINEIHMPFDGKIKKIHVEKGQRISKNFLMVEIE
ncbi:biotin/lipoyl-containing protein [Marinilabilia salmonicolor]|jgi:biotin carboxyl carrier protein|uniref:Biotin-dependent enzyme n=1 Tax=Marinilabilia salmonicolor TaxID=989 RepID=A0A2T0XA83_9BACT|nr:biotin/lipoyl-containing protein [Marinilabilia salmonicolor]PRY95839.1 biotin-dependent enzyme [Marinilabilia salmonicolor]RCW36614.1 biotin-dependent enzyme [Marinilabilia salmonicolor]